MSYTKSIDPGRSQNTLKKLERMNKALRHEEPDRVPISDFFWGSFVSRWRRELGLPEDVQPLTHYDLDWVVTIPNADPWVSGVAGATYDYIVGLVREYGKYPLALGEFEEPI